MANQVGSNTTHEEKQQKSKARMVKGRTSKALLDGLYGSRPICVVGFEAAVLLPHERVGCPDARCDGIHLLSCFQGRHLLQNALGGCQPPSEYSKYKLTQEHP